MILTFLGKRESEELIHLPREQDAPGIKSERFRS